MDRQDWRVIDAFAYFGAGTNFAFATSSEFGMATAPFGW